MISIDVTTAGSAGSASGDKTEAIPDGRLWGIGIDYTAEPATTDVTVTLVGPGGVELVLLTRSNSATDLPLTGILLATIDTAGAAAAVAGGAPVSGQVRVNVAQGDPAGTVIVHLLIEDIEPF